LKAEIKQIIQETAAAGTMTFLLVILVVLGE
jgi:hypothetical protein